MSEITIRAIRHDEWREVRELRLHALQDASADVAFHDSFEEAVTRPDEFWQQRASNASEQQGSTATARQFVAVTADGTWVGTTAVLLPVISNDRTDQSQQNARIATLVGVYVDEEHRGTGLLARIIEAALQWTRENGCHWLELLVHTENDRARRAYEKLGFEPTGATESGPNGLEIELIKCLRSTNAASANTTSAGRYSVAQSACNTTEEHV